MASADFVNGNDYIFVRKVRPDLPTLVGFSSVNTPRGMFKPFKIYDQVSCNLILLNDAGNFWYQNGIPGVSGHSSDAALKILDFARSIGNGRVCTFGTSMGAGGAALFAALGGADACLSFGLEPVLASEGSRSSLHLPKGFSPAWRDFRENIERSTSVYFAYASETDEADLRGALSLKNIPNVVQFSVVGCEHPGLQVFDLDRSIGEMITNFVVYGRPPSGFPRQGWLFSRWAAVEALVSADGKRRVGDLGAGLRSLEEANRLFPCEPSILAKLGNFYQADRRGDAAAASWEAAIRLCPDHYEAHTKLANHLLRKGDRTKALAHARAAFDIYPRSGHVCHSLGSALSAVGMKSEALPFLERALKISPNNQTFKKSLEDITST